MGTVDNFRQEWVTRNCLPMSGKEYASDKPKRERKIKEDMNRFTVFLSSILLLASLSVGAEADKTLQDVSFIARCDGTTQHYVVMLSEGFKAEESHSLLIALHGHGSDRWQFAQDPRDECRAARDVTAENRMIFVSPDYRAKTSWMGPKAEAGYYECCQAIPMLRRPGCPVRRNDGRRSFALPGCAGPGGR